MHSGKLWVIQDLSDSITHSMKRDVVLIGAGIMSATLGTMIRELLPHKSIRIYERLDAVAAESSDAWNNAGTGHSAFCELNYTPERQDGSIDTTKAIKIASSFEQSKQFWSYLVNNGYLKRESFIRRIPHISFVWGRDNCDFLRRRYEALTACHLFAGMEYTEDPAVLQQWVPLMMKDRTPDQPLAATRMDSGTDVNFGALTRGMVAHLQTTGVELKMGQEIRDIRQKDHHWHILAKDLHTGEKHEITAEFVFIGAGGGSLALLDKSGIPEAEGYGGFPISGQWLRCTNEEVIEKHYAKVYGKADVGAPPMSVPHLDTRIIDGKQALLFGPFAGFSTKFLKAGSYLDLPKSLEWTNLYPMMAAGLRNIPLTRYLIQQVSLTPQERLDTLRTFYPNAKMEDWELAIAGQRVQVIKKDEEEGGVLEFGTEIVGAANGTISALLGASPGASTSVAIMLEILLHSCYKNELSAPQVIEKIQEMIPTYGKSLAEDALLCAYTRQWTEKALGYAG